MSPTGRRITPDSASQEDRDPPRSAQLTGPSNDGFSTRFALKEQFIPTGGVESPVTVAIAESDESPAWLTALRCTEYSVPCTKGLATLTDSHRPTSTKDESNS